MKIRMLSILIPVLLGIGGVVQAGDVKIYKADEVPDAADVARMLGGGRQAEPQQRPKMRGIVLEPAYDREAPRKQALQQIAKPSENAFALPIRFAFNSADILPEAEPQLDAVSKGIKMVPGAKIVVEGHTDATGPEDYNLRLSLMRAKAVRDYLVYKHGIDPHRILVEGKGEKDLLDPDHPYAPENRAVAFRRAEQ